MEIKFWVLFKAIIAVILFFAMIIGIPLMFKILVMLFPIAMGVFSILFVLLIFILAVYIAYDIMK